MDSSRSHSDVPGHTPCGGDDRPQQVPSTFKVFAWSSPTAMIPAFAPWLRSGIYTLYYTTPAEDTHSCTQVYG